MFSAIYRYNITKTVEYVKELSLRFLEMKTELKNSYWFVFIDAFVSADSRKITAHCNISANTQDYELKISIHMNFDTLMSNLKSYFQYGIVMTSLWRNIWKISKATTFVS